MAFLEGRQVLPASLIDTIATTAELSTLYSYVNGSTKLFNLFNETEAFTYLAPNNDAFASYLNQTPTATVDEIEAILEYHLLNGTINTGVTFTNQSQFVQTYLTNATYSNITILPAGQRLEYVLDSNNDPVFLSSNKSVTSIEPSNKVCGDHI
jgi:uncharacterized surface protein with fasciclin (FAS1) repeats